MKRKKRFVMARGAAIMLSLIMTFTVFPMSASAVEGDNADGNTAAETTATPDYEPGQLIVVTEQGTSKKQMKSIVKGVDGEVENMSAMGDETKVALIEVEEGSELAAAAELESEDSVLFVQPNYIYEQESNEPSNIEIEEESTDELENEAPLRFPNDKFYFGECPDNDEYYPCYYKGQKKYLSPFGEEGEVGTINAKGAWEQLADLENQLADPNEKKKPVVAVIDTGANYEHEDLNNNSEDSPIIVKQCVTFNDGVQMGFLDGDNALDDNGHGTRVTGIIGAKLNNEIGIAGVAGNRVEMFVIDASIPKEKPNDDSVYYSIDIAKAIHYAYSLDPNDPDKKPADLINMSVGMYKRDYLCETEVENAWKNGTLCITSAGNITTDYMHYPGDSPYAVTVMGHYLNATSIGCGYGVEKDISAPGYDLHTTRVNGYSNNFDGTSGAAPIVTGSAALLLYANPDLTPRQIKNLLYTSTGRDTDEEIFRPEEGGQGFGRINIDTALRNLLAEETDPEKIVINKTSIEMFEGGDTGIEYAVYPGNTSTADVTFTSSNEDVAVVDGDGIVSAKAPGSTTITASCGTCEDVRCEVTVKEIPCRTIDRKPYCTEDSFATNELIDEDIETNETGTVTGKYGYKYHRYNIDLEANETISAFMTGQEFGPLLRIKDEGGNIVAVGVGDWDGRTGANKVEFQSEVTYTAEHAGTYQIQAMQLCAKGRTGTNYDFKLASDRAFCEPEIKSISDGQMCMSWPEVEDADCYVVRKYANYADIAQAEPEVEETITDTEFTDMSYDESKANYYTVTSCLQTKAGTLFNGETPLFIKLQNPLLLKGKRAKANQKTLKKKSVKLPRYKVIKFKNNIKDKKTYKLLSAKKGKKSFKRYFKIYKKTGKVRIKKGLKKGTYKVRVRVNAAGNHEYNALTKTVTFRIRVR